MSQINIIKYPFQRSIKLNQSSKEKQNNQQLQDSYDEILYSGNAIQSRRLLKKILSQNAKNTKLDEIKESNKEKEQIIASGFLPNVKQILTKIKNFNIKDSIINYFKGNQNNENLQIQQQDKNNQKLITSQLKNTEHKLNNNEMNKELQIINNNFGENSLNDNQDINKNIYNTNDYINNQSSSMKQYNNQNDFKLNEKYNNLQFSNLNQNKKENLLSIQEQIQLSAKKQVEKLVNEERIKKRINWIPSENLQVPFNEAKQQKKKIQKVQKKIEQKAQKKNKFIVNDDQSQNIQQSEDECYYSLDELQYPKQINSKSSTQKQIYLNKASKKTKIIYDPTDEINTSCSSDDNEIKNKINKYKKSRARQNPSLLDEPLQNNNTNISFQNLMSQITESKEIIESLGQFLKKVNHANEHNMFDEKKKEEIHQQILLVLQQNNMQQLKECAEFSSYFNYRGQQTSNKELPQNQEFSTPNKNPFNIDSVFNKSASKQDELMENTIQEEQSQKKSSINIESKHQTETKIIKNEQINNGNENENRVQIDKHSVNNIFTTINQNNSVKINNDNQQNIFNQSKPIQNDIQIKEEQEEINNFINNEKSQISNNLKTDKQESVTKNNEQNYVPSNNLFASNQNKQKFILETKINNETKQDDKEQLQNNSTLAQNQNIQTQLSNNNDNQETPIKKLFDNQALFNSEVKKINNQNESKEIIQSPTISNIQEQQPLLNPFGQMNNPFSTPANKTNKQQPQSFSLDKLIEQNSNKNLFTNSAPQNYNNSDNVNNNLFNKANNIFGQISNTQTPNNNNNNIFLNNNTQNNNNWLNNQNTQNNSQNNQMQSNLFSNNQSNNIFNGSEQTQNFNQNQNLFSSNNNYFGSNLNNNNNAFSINNQNNNQFLNQGMMTNSNQNNTTNNLQQNAKNLFQTQNNIQNNNNGWNFNQNTNNNSNQLLNNSSNQFDINNQNSMGIETQFSSNNNFNNSTYTNQFSNNYFNNNAFNTPNSNVFYESQVTNYLAQNSGASNLFQDSSSKKNDDKNADMNANSNLNTPSLFDNSSSKAKQNKNSANQSKIQRLLGNNTTQARIY